MTEFERYVVATENKAAFLLAIWEELGERPGTIANASYSELAEIAARRGVALTDSKIRKRVADCEAEGIFEIVPRRERGRFDLYVYRLAPSETAEPTPKRERETPLFDFYGAAVLNRRFGNGCGNGGGEEAEARSPEIRGNVGEKRNAAGVSGDLAAERERGEISRAPSKEININNKLINKPARDFLEIDETSRKVGRPIERPKEAEKPGLRGSADGSRAVAVDAAEVRDAVDFDAPKIRRLRERVAFEIWEPEVNPDLIDRATGAIALRLVSVAEFRGIVAQARNERRAFERFEGRGKRTLWETVNWRIKSAFERAGWSWSPTRLGREPKPTAPPKRAPAVAVPDDDDPFDGMTPELAARVLFR